MRSVLTFAARRNQRKAAVRLALLGSLCSLTPVQALSAARQDPSLEIEQRLRDLRATGSMVVDGETMRYSPLLDSLYRGRRYAPVWTNRDVTSALSRFVANVAADGLEPAHYHHSVLARTDSVTGHGARIAELDLLRTDALLRAGYHVRFGKVDPARLTTDHELTWPLWHADMLAESIRLLTTGQLAPRLRPRNFVYTGLVAALAALRAIEKDGGWPLVPHGPRLELGANDSRVVALRRRLVASGDLAIRDSSIVFDTVVAAAVRSFQHRHALDVDGVVGPATLAALNTSTAHRIEQVRLNLERARWIREDGGDLRVIVNVAGAQVFAVRNGDVVFEARAIVGGLNTRTPVFSAAMRHIELNPTWTVPPGIVGEVLAQLKRDSGYLKRQRIRVFTRNGTEVSVSAIVLRQYTRATFPYVFRQDPGPANPLGVIKFVFPNPYNVYLHDTPARQLFESERRTLSHGCVRVQDPLELAVLLLDEPDRWSVPHLQEEIDRGATRALMLRQPVPVLIHYWTAAIDEHNELHFYRDVYQRDAALLRALVAE